MDDYCHRAVLVKIKEMISKPEIEKEREENTRTRKGEKVWTLSEYSLKKK